LEAAVLAAELRPYGVVQKETARQGFLGAVSACGLDVGYMTGTVPLVASSIGWHAEAKCFPRSMHGDQVFNGCPLSKTLVYSTVGATLTGLNSISCELPARPPTSRGDGDRQRDSARCVSRGWLEKLEA
jgi:hypothetical protein